ncbi:hypothetical protein KI387_029845, partial [Taxus chinensis]
FKEHEIDKCKLPEQLGSPWNLMFDGACSNFGNGVSIVLISPDKKEFNFSFKLQFECTNNIAEYEALLLGLRISWRY